MNVLFVTKSPFCAVPTGLRGNCWCRHPALKRCANEHCAYGAAEIRNPQVDFLDSCDCPGSQGRVWSAGLGGSEASLARKSRVRDPQRSFRF